MRYHWLILLGVGILLFAVLSLEARSSAAQNLLTALLFVDAFTVPFSLVVYFYEHIRDHDISKPLLAACFGVGGALGLAAAGFIEFKTLRTLNLGALVAVGFTEETSKPIFSLFMYMRWRDRHEADGCSSACLLVWVSPPSKQLVMAYWLSLKAKAAWVRWNRRCCCAGCFLRPGMWPGRDWFAPYSGGTAREPGILS